MPRKKYNVERIRLFVGDDQEMMQKMVGIFLNNTPKMLGIIRKSLNEKDYHTLQFISHKLKTSIDHFSIETLTSDIRKIEKCAKKEIDLESLPSLIDKLELELQETMAEIKSDFKIT